MVENAQHFDKENLGRLGFKMDVGRGFVFLNFKTPESTKRVLALTPQMLPWCTAIYQEWVYVFNHNHHPMNLKLPTCIILRMLLVKYKLMEEKVANPRAHNLRFCVALELNKGWVDKKVNN
jgi:hypothetical protein